MTFVQSFRRVIAVYRWALVVIVAFTAFCFVAGDLPLDQLWRIAAIIAGVLLITTMEVHERSQHEGS